MVDKYGQTNELSAQKNYYILKVGHWSRRIISVSCIIRPADELNTASFCSQIVPETEKHHPSGVIMPHSSGSVFILDP